MDNEYTSVRIPKWLNYLLHIKAAEQSAAKNKRVSVSGLITDACKDKYQVSEPAEK